MAKTNAVWGIDIGQSALKALRCKLEDGKIVADAFDYIEYPKILSQPEAEPEVLIREALEQFLSRNEIKGDKVAISVPGQSGLAKFFKPPPVDAKKIPDIVKYEARQQIPFALEDVIWDYQQMGGGAEVDGFALETEVGLFAMKREQVYRAIRPFDNAGLELDIIQLAPLSIYNFVTYELLDKYKPEEFDPDNPPESLVVLSVGTDTTDLVITNGFRVWQRSIPLGGNHFTKQLTKELKLTFAKAEHLKRNARQAEDPKSVFQAMRPVFNDIVTEVQRSIGYFQSIDRKAKIGGVVLLGNAMKLPGLRQYLAKHLGYDVVDFEAFSKLEGGSVLGSPSFKDNMLAFGVSYGLCLQGLKLGRLQTNLVPRELLTDRLIREKKPWTVAAVAALLLACAVNFFFYFEVWKDVDPERTVQNVSWEQAENQVASVQQQSRNYETEDRDRVAKLNFLTSIGEEVVGDGDRRLLWLELLRAVNAVLPRTPNVGPGEIPDPKALPFGRRHELHIEHIESQFFSDLATWFSEPLKNQYIRHTVLPLAGEGSAAQGGAANGNTTATDPLATPSDPAAEVTGPQGSGWVIELKGYHYFNEESALARGIGGAAHVRNTLLKNLSDGQVPLPAPGQGMMTFNMKELGIGFPTLVVDSGRPRDFKIPNPNFAGSAAAAQGMGSGIGGPGAMGMGMGVGMGMGMGAGAGATARSGQAAAGNQKQGGANGEEAAEQEPPFYPAKRYDFVVQFVWQPKPLSERLAERQRLEQEQQQQEGVMPETAQGDVPATVLGAQ